MFPPKISGPSGGIPSASVSQDAFGSQRKPDPKTKAEREFKAMIQATQFRDCTSIEELAQAQYDRHISHRSRHLPPRPHSLDLPFKTTEQAQESMRRFEQTTSAFVDAATALLEASSPAWGRARCMRQPTDQAAADFRLRDISPRYEFANNEAASWANSLPFGTNAASAYKTNCYGYACNKAKDQKSSNIGHDLHPGNVTGLEYWDRDAPVEPGREEYAELELPARSATVQNVLRKALADGLSLEPLPGGYPVYFALAPDDYHWYRQDRTGYWSHKPGPNAVKNKDGNGKVADELITNPMLANRRHGYTHYDRGGCFLWVPADFGSNSRLPLYEPMNVKQLGAVEKSRPPVTTAAHSTPAQATVAGSIERRTRRILEERLQEKTGQEKTTKNDAQTPGGR